MVSALPGIFVIRVINARQHSPRSVRENCKTINKSRRNKHKSRERGTKKNNNKKRMRRCANCSNTLRVFLLFFFFRCSRTSKRTCDARVGFGSIVFRFSASQFRSNDCPTAMTTSTTHATLFIFAIRIRFLCECVCFALAFQFACCLFYACVRRCRYRCNVWLWLFLPRPTHTQYTHCAQCNLPNVAVSKINRTFAKRALRMHREFGQRSVPNTLLARRSIERENGR